MKFLLILLGAFLLPAESIHSRLPEPGLLGEKVRKDTIFDGTPCPLVPLILVFDPEGKIVKSLLKQADVPDSLREESNIGQVSFGLSGDKVWFWQPAKHRMIITDREGSAIRKTSIRHAHTWNLGGLTLLMPTGEIIQDLLSPTPNAWGIYIVKNNRVERLRHPQNAFLVGIDGSEFVFVSKTKDMRDSFFGLAHVGPPKHSYCGTFSARVLVNRSALSAGQ